MRRSDMSMMIAKPRDMFAKTTFRAITAKQDFPWLEKNAINVLLRISRSGLIHQKSQAYDAA